MVTAILLVCFQNVAWAAGNMTGIEQKWLDFQRELKAKQVKDGKITREKADQYLKDLESKLKQSEEDIVYDRFQSADKGKDARFSEKFMELYAKMTNRSAEEVAKQCKDAKVTVLELAKKEGNLEKFKSFIVQEATEKLKALVQDGKITKEQMDKKLKRLQDLMGSFS